MFSVVLYCIKNFEELWGEDFFVCIGIVLWFIVVGMCYLCSVQVVFDMLYEFVWFEFSKQCVWFCVVILFMFGCQYFVLCLFEFNGLYLYIDLELYFFILFFDVKVEDIDVEICYGIGCYLDLKIMLLFNELVFLVCGCGYFEQISGNIIIEVLQLLNFMLLCSFLELWCLWFEVVGLDVLELVIGLLFNDIGLMFEVVVFNQGVVLVWQVMVCNWLGLGQIVWLLDIELVLLYVYYIVQCEQVLMKFEVWQFVDWLLGLDW